MAKPKLKILVVNRPLRIEEHPVNDIFLIYKQKNYDIVLFPPKETKKRTELIVLNTELMDPIHWAELLGVAMNDNEEELPFYDFDLENVEEQTTYDILDQKFEVITTNLTTAEEQQTPPAETKIVFRPVNLFLQQDSLNIQENRAVGFYEDNYDTEKYPSLEKAMEKKDYVTVSTGHTENNLLCYRVFYHLTDKEEFIICNNQDPRFAEDYDDNQRMLAAVIAILVPDPNLN